MGRSKNQRPNLRQPAPPTKRPYPTSVLPIPHSLMLSLPPVARWILCSVVGSPELPCFGTFLDSGKRRNSKLPSLLHPLYRTSALYSLWDNPPSKGFLGLCCVSFFLFTLFLPRELDEKPSSYISQWGGRVGYLQNWHCVGRNAVYIVWRSRNSSMFSNETV